MYKSGGDPPDIFVCMCELRSMSVASSNQLARLSSVHTCCGTPLKEEPGARRLGPSMLAVTAEAAAMVAAQERRGFTWEQHQDFQWNRLLVHLYITYTNVNFPD